MGRGGLDELSRRDKESASHARPGAVILDRPSVEDAVMAREEPGGTGHQAALGFVERLSFSRPRLPFGRAVACPAASIEEGNDGFDACHSFIELRRRDLSVVQGPFEDAEDSVLPRHHGSKPWLRHSAQGHGLEQVREAFDGFDDPCWQSRLYLRDEDAVFAHDDRPAPMIRPKSMLQPALEGVVVERQRRALCGWVSLEAIRYSAAKGRGGGSRRYSASFSSAPVAYRASGRARVGWSAQSMLVETASLTAQRTRRVATP